MNKSARELRRFERLRKRPLPVPVRRAVGRLSIGKVLGHFRQRVKAGDRMKGAGRLHTAVCLARRDVE